MLRSKGLAMVLTLCVLSLTLSGCYWQRQVEESQRGLVMPDGATVQEVVGAGRYTNLGWYAELRTVDVSAKTTTWSDPDLVTADKQPIGLEVGITYRRMSESDNIRSMWSDYRAEATSDNAMAQQVLNRIPRVAKEVTSEYTLDEMLGVAAGEGSGRTVLTQDLFTKLEPELAEAHIQLLDVGINNISPSEEYLSLLEDKANAQVRVEVAREETKALEEQLAQEQAQTEIELEKARRQNQVNAELAKTYEQSPEYYELERLRLLQGVLGEQDKLYFIPQGTSLSLILAGEGDGPMPVVPAPPVEPSE
jgi:regulator of protease activity HflC (stomatin/prohibitin superfamily)